MREEEKMNLSETISALEIMRTQFGNLPVGLPDGDGWAYDLSTIEYIDDEYTVAHIALSGGCEMDRKSKLTSK